VAVPSPRLRRMTAKLISVRHRKSSAGDAAPNLYFIRDVVGHSDYLADDTDNGSRPHRPQVVGHIDTNKTQFDKTHQQDSANNAPVLSHSEEAKPAPEADWRHRYDALYGRSTNT
jgi:hypothetical protein